MMKFYYLKDSLVNMIEMYLITYMETNKIIVTTFSIK
jgi:hypothetical protein